MRPTASASRARAYHGKWNSSDQLAENAVPLVGFFGTLNPTDGGNSERYSLQAEWHRADENSETKIMAYGFYYDLDLFSDFTYYLTDPNLGDQFEQQDRRWVADWTRGTRFSASGLAATWKIHSACKSATTGSTTAFTRRKTACAWINGFRHRHRFARHHGSGLFYRHGSRSLCGKQSPVDGQIPLGPGHARRPGLL
jgi:hypothetical protein